MKLLVTGGAGFIGSAFIRYVLKETDHTIINIDVLTYAGDLENLENYQFDDRHIFENIDINEREKLHEIFEKHKPDGVLHLAAETHVDRSIESPNVFVKTNVLGTSNLLEVTTYYWQSLNYSQKDKFRFLYVSTDEVYGSLLLDDERSIETSLFKPKSPYAASKASADHLVASWFNTYGLPTIIIRPSNNYGPYQYPEKLIPTVILSAIEKREIPVYGAGKNIRDWLYVDDHAKALFLAFINGKVGDSYNVGGGVECTNIDVVRSICKLIDDMTDCNNSEQLITFVKDRPGHDLRYSMDSNCFHKNSGWSPQNNFDSGLKITVKWYLDNIKWIEKIKEKGFTTKRIGLANKAYQHA